jgi:hypothetical protein
MDTFDHNREVVEKYMTAIGAVPQLVVEKNISNLKKGYLLEYWEVPIFSKKYWEDAGAKGFKQGCELITKNGLVLHSYHPDQVIF